MDSLRASLNAMVGPGMAHSAAVRGDNGQIGVLARLALNEPQNANLLLSVRLKRKNVIADEKIISVEQTEKSETKFSE